MGKFAYLFWYVNSFVMQGDLYRDPSFQHAPGEDQWGYEDASERWLPIHTVETIVRHCLSFRLSGWLVTDRPPTFASPCAGWENVFQLMSVISLLSQDPPSLDSPANVDAAVRARSGHN